ncbi:Ig-like domain-containing protein [Pontiellaceae bacterium B1224]|nr:Ig-like domain-containing protein [Pontiellaceae bacterium B1224]
MKMRRLGSLAVLAVMLLASAGQAQILIYQDNYDNDGLGVNTNAGGGMLNRTASVHSWTDNEALAFLDNGNGSFRNRAIAYTENAFQSDGGFQLDVTYQLNATPNGAVGGAQLSWGLISADTDLSTYGLGGNTSAATGFSPFGGTDAEATNVYSVGIQIISGAGLNFTDGAGVTVLDASSFPNIPGTGATNISFSVVDDGLGGADWSLSLGPTNLASGNITVFDFTKSYRFASYGQDDNRSFQIDSVSLYGLGNQAPIADAQSVTATVGTSQAITLSGWDPDSGPGSLEFTVETQPAYGTLSGTAPNLIYTPHAGYLGEDYFTFTCNDSSATGISATVSISVVRPGRSLHFADLSSALANNTLNVDGSTNNLEVASFVDGYNYIYSVTYTGADFDGDALNDTLTFEVLVEAWDGGEINTEFTSTDAEVNAYHGSAEIGGNDVPVTIGAEGWAVNAANMLSGETLQYSLQYLNVTATRGGNYTAALDRFTGTFFNESGTSYGHLTVIGEGAGLLDTRWNSGIRDLTGVLDEWAPLYISSANLNGLPDNSHQSWQVQDIDFDLLVWETAINQVPEAHSLSITAFPDHDLDFALKTRDLEGSLLNYTITDAPTNGSLSGEGSDRTYSPDPGFQGTDSFTYYVSGGGDESFPATVSITVTNMVPVANAQSVATIPDTGVGITLTASDADSGPSNLIYTVTAFPTYGSLTGAVPNVTYIPASGYIGSDSFTFTVNDGYDESAPAVVSITVNNQPPTADPQSVEVFRNGTLDVTLTASDLDGPSNLTYFVESFPTNGSLNGTVPNLTYEPVADYVGFDSFTFSAYDGMDTSAVVTVSITVINNPPVADSKVVWTQPDTSAEITLTGSDQEGSNLTFNVVSLPAGGLLATNGVLPNLTYTPINGFTGTDSFTYTVNDGEEDSAPATVTIRVSDDGFNLSFEDLGTALSGNTLTVDGLADNLTVSGVATNNDYLYAVTYTHADMDGDGLSDTLTFDVLVEGWSDGAITTSAALSNGVVVATNGTATIGTTDADVLLGAYGWAVDDATMNPGQTLVFTLQNLSLALTGDSLEGSKAEIGFTSAAFRETGGSYGHQTVIGVGTGLLESRWDATVHTLSGLGTGSESLYISSAPQNGTGANTQRWAVEGIDFGIMIVLGSTAPADVTAGIISGGTQMELCWEGRAGKTYGVQTTDDLVYGSWSNLITDIEGGDGQMCITNNISGDQRFFRTYFQE